MFLKLAAQVLDNVGQVKSLNAQRAFHRISSRIFELNHNQQFYSISKESATKPYSKLPIKKNHNLPKLTSS